MQQCPPIYLTYRAAVVTPVGHEMFDLESGSCDAERNPTATPPLTG